MERTFSTKIETDIENLENEFKNEKKKDLEVIKINDLQDISFKKN